MQQETIRNLMYWVLERLRHETNPETQALLRQQYESLDKEFAKEKKPCVN